MVRDFFKNKYVKIAAAAVVFAVLVLLSLVSKDTEVSTDDTYIDALETKLASRISEISGVYGVSVMLTAEDFQMPNRQRSLFGTPAPAADTHSIKGAAVVCGGADDPLVKEKVVEYVSKVLGIGASRVCVVS